MAESPLSVRRLFSLFFLLWIGVSLHAQHRSLRFQHFTTENGLPQNMVDCMLQDHQGFMWFGTWNGLCRFDGYNFEIFNSETFDQAQLSNFIYALYEDDFDNIWVGNYKGLHIYLYDKGVFSEAISSDSVTFEGSVNHIQKLANSKVWIATSKGISEIVIDDNNGSFRVIQQISFGKEVREIPATIARGFLQIGESVWVATDNGIWILEKSGNISSLKFDPTNPSSLSSDIVTCMYRSNQSGIWVGTEIGLNHYENGTFTRYYHNPLNEITLIHNTVTDIKEDQSGNLIVATLGGLSIWQAGLDSFVNHRNEQNRQHSLNNEFINCLYLDTQSNIWIGTERGGVNFLSANQNTFEHFEHELGNSNSLSNSTINAVFEDAEAIWIGTAGGGLNRFDKKTRTFKHYLTTPGSTTSISSNFVTGILRDSQGSLWVTTWGFGIDRLLNEGKSGERFEHFQSNQHPGLASNFISSFVEERPGRFWIGTLNGLVRFDLETRQFHLVNPGEIKGVGCLAFENERILWVGTRTGLHRLDISNDPIQKREFRNATSDPTSVSGNYVISALRDGKGSMWFGTYGQGLNRLLKRGEGFSFERFTTADGLGNGIIYGILQDERDQLWLSTDYGLSRLDPSTRNVRNFYVNDGLLNNQYYWSAAYRNNEGKLYFGGMNGLDTFFPDWIRENSTQSNVIITDIKLLNESVIPGREYNGVEVLSESISKSKSISLSYKEKIFAIEFSSFNYQEPGQIHYEYKLEGFDVNWNKVDAQRRYANYTNLKPGSYEFKVKVAGLQSQDGKGPVTSLIVRINPPFWETTWFRILAGVLLLSAVMGYIRLRTITLRRQKLVLERQVAERTERINQQNEALSYQAIQLQKSNTELEGKQEQIEGQNQKLESQNKEIASQRDELIYLNNKLNTVNQLKLSFFTNISHEFRTPLTLILGPLERLLKERNPSETQNSLNIIHRNAQRLLHLVNQIMDFRKIEQGRMELCIQNGDLKSFCTNISEAFQPLADIKRIDFTIRVGELPQETWFDHQVIENILYNLLSNAFKYTPDGGQVTLEVRSMTLSESKLDELKNLVADSNRKTIIGISVNDSGVGISEENLPLVFKRFYRINSEESLRISGSGIGLALTEELIKTHHGEIFVQSALGTGSQFEIQFPCLREAYHVKELTEIGHDHTRMREQVQVLTREFERTESEAISDAEIVIDKSRPTLLVVEDNQDLRTFITHKLNRQYNIYEAGNGVEGLKIAQKVDPDLIISDIMMPKMDGLEFCASIKNNLDTSHIPVILLTAKSSVENQLEGLHVGADDYLPKPFNFEILEARVHNQIETRSRLRKQFLATGDIDLEEMTSSSRDQKFLELALRTVEDNLSNSDFGVSNFVVEMGISRSLLHKKLSALTNQSAADFINHIRLKKAAALLKDADLNVSQVAYSVGYGDPKYFTRLFTKHYGVSPREFTLSPQSSIE